MTHAPPDYDGYARTRARSIELSRDSNGLDSRQLLVSVVHVAKGELAAPFLLDNRESPIITAYLFHIGGHEDPAPLRANANTSFIGSYVLGMGFTFDDTDRKEVASPLADMRRVIEADASNQERIFPYVGGEDLTESPTQETTRFIINFEEWPLRRDASEQRWKTANEEQRSLWRRKGIVPLDYPGQVAADYPALLSIVERRVRGTRASHATAPWWQYERPGASYTGR